MPTDNLWAPWRMQYINQLDDDSPPAGDACFLCAAVKAAREDQQQADEMLVLLEDDRGLIILNRYPYTSGHLLVAPNTHVADLAAMSPESRAGLIELTTLAEQIIRAAYNPQGVNIGINLGRCAGAGLPGHLHVHIVPRWAGDTNFMQVVGQVRVIPEALEASYQRLRDALAMLQA